MPFRICYLFWDLKNIIKVGLIIILTFFFRTYKLESNDDWLHETAFLNNDSSTFCTGRILKHPKKGLLEAVNCFYLKFMDAFFTRNFNNDIRYCHDRAIDSGLIEDVDDWENRSRRDPSFVMKLKWIRYKRLKSYLNYVANIEDMDIRSGGYYERGLKNGCS